MRSKRQNRIDAVTEHDGGWYGANGSKDKKDPPKRLFRTREEAEALDSLLMVTGDRAKKP